MKSTTVLRALTILSVGLLIFVLTCTSSNDFSQDLGRHLTLGNIIRQTHSVPATNLFSYTNPSYPFVNHHWLSEVVFSIVHQFGGVPSLILLKSFFIMATVAILYMLGARQSSVLSTGATILILAPLLLERSDIRPEVFGYFYFAYLLYVIERYKSLRKLLWTVPIVLLLWINTHITFVFGGLLSVWIVAEIWTDRKSYPWQYIWLLPLSMALAVLLNPHGLYGVFYPLFIFGNYGYSIVENQNIIFLLQHTHNIILIYFLATLPLAVVAFLVLLYRKKYRYVFFLTVFTIFALSQIRHLPFYMFIMIPSTAITLQYLASLIPRRYRNVPLLSCVTIALAVIISIVFISGVYGRTYEKKLYFGLSYNEDGKGAADFLLTHNLPGPIFNNFDIGGYAIYRLYPTYKVFVDNRPEAYPQEFVQNTYIALQIDPEIRRKIFSRYNIQTIFFSHTDQTSWATDFLSSITKEKEWRLVYLDSAMIVLTKDTKLADLREDPRYTDKRIAKEDNYLNLLLLANAFLSLQEARAANMAFAKAIVLNPGACVIQKNLYVRATNGLPLMQDQNVQYPWYCP